MKFILGILTFPLILSLFQMDHPTTHTRDKESIFYQYAEEKDTSYALAEGSCMLEGDTMTVYFDTKEDKFSHTGVVLISHHGNHTLFAAKTGGVCVLTRKIYHPISKDIQVETTANQEVHLHLDAKMVYVDTTTHLPDTMILWGNTTLEIGQAE